MSTGILGSGEQDPDLIVVGSGLYGLTIAERAAAHGFCVLVIERRSHIGGNAWSETYPGSEIEVHKYGSHLFHTSNDRVWDYVNRFSDFTDYRHHVWTVSAGRVFPLPFSLATINSFFGLSLSPEEARRYLASRVEGDPQEARNLEAFAVATVGREMYEALIAGYTYKQWQTDPKALPRETISRLPIRFTYDTRYFQDRYQGLPVAGYGKMIQSMASAPGVRVLLNTDYSEIRDDLPPNVPIVYTGPIDEYFSFTYGRLTWRTIDFEWQKLDLEDFQGTAVLNYADRNVPYTRIHEFKHLHPERTYSRPETVIAREFSRFAEAGDEPFYPVNSSHDRRALLAYRDAISREAHMVFGGRLGSYQYLDMHMAIASALSAFDGRVLALLRRDD